MICGSNICLFVPFFIVSFRPVGNSSSTPDVAIQSHPRGRSRSYSSVERPSFTAWDGQRFAPPQPSSTETGRLLRPGLLSSSGERKGESDCGLYGIEPVFSGHRLQDGNRKDNPSGVGDPEIQLRGGIRHNECLPALRHAGGRPGDASYIGTRRHSLPSPLRILRFETNPSSVDKGDESGPSDLQGERHRLHDLHRRWVQPGDDGVGSLPGSYIHGPNYV